MTAARSSSLPIETMCRFGVAAIRRTPVIRAIFEAELVPKITAARQAGSEYLTSANRRTPLLMAALRPSAARL
jgi:hypothetical protein